jgi:hypothetical protein
MSLSLLLMAGFLLLLPAAILLLFFLVALADYTLAGGARATTTGSNETLRIHEPPTHSSHRTSRLLLDAESLPFDFPPSRR